MMNLALNSPEFSCIARDCQTNKNYQQEDALHKVPVPPRVAIPAPVGNVGGEAEHAVDGLGSGFGEPKVPGMISC
jgi:hypothetical protein